LDIAWAALLENGAEIDRDTHAGFAGATPSKPAYVLRLPARRPGATYTLRASVAGRGGTDSSGIVYRPNWD
jgi:hexosaminidase